MTALETAGSDVDGMSPTYLAHRYVRRGTMRPVTVDVLAPEGLGPRADLTTTRPGRTILTPKDSKRLRIAGQLRDPRHPGWMLVPADIRVQGRQAYDILCSDG